MNHTVSPIVTGSSVLGVKYRDGVMIVTDTLVSYGSLKKFTNVPRLHKVGVNTVIGASGEYSDFQYISDHLDEQDKKEILYDDGDRRGPAEWASYLSVLMYNRRNKMNPLFNSIVIGGVDPQTGSSFLGLVDLYGTYYKDDVIATGYGAHLAIPLMRERARTDMSEEDARVLLLDCMRVLYYRDCRATDKIQYAVATIAGVDLSREVEVRSQWDHKLWVTPTIAIGDMLGASW